MFKFPYIILLSFALVSCATARDSVLLGIGVGSVVGGGMGAAAGAPDHNETRASLVGTAIGAALGGLSGYLAHKEDVEKRTTMIGQPSADRAGNPSLTNPEVDRVWVPDRIEGDQLVRGHYIYVIRRPSSWRLGHDK